MTIATEAHHSNLAIFNLDPCGQYICDNVRAINDRVLAGNVVACIKYPTVITEHKATQMTYTHYPLNMGARATAFISNTQPYYNNPSGYKDSLIKAIDVAIRQAESRAEGDAIKELRKQRDGIEKYGYPVPVSKKGEAR